MRRDWTNQKLTCFPATPLPGLGLFRSCRSSSFIIVLHVRGPCASVRSMKHAVRSSFFRRNPYLIATLHIGMRGGRSGSLQVDEQRRGLAGNCLYHPHPPAVRHLAVRMHRGTTTICRQISIAYTVHARNIKWSLQPHAPKAGEAGIFSLRLLPIRTLTPCCPQPTASNN